MRGIDFETERFRLRCLLPHDASKRYRSWFNPETARLGIRSARHRPSIRELRTFIAERMDRHDVLFLGIFTKSNAVHIGNVKYEPINREEAYAVMGILIGEQEWRGKGVAGEVLRPTARWLRDHCGIHEIVLGVMKSNTSARRGYEKVGFRLQPSRRIRIDPEQHESMVWRLDEVAP